MELCWQARKRVWALLGAHAIKWYGARRTILGQTQSWTGADAAIPSPALEVSVVIPCLNEANSLGICIDKALRAFAEGSLSGEVVVADNGSTDGSIEIAESHGARVVNVNQRGYGAALRAGIAASRGRYIVMGDADDSY